MKYELVKDYKQVEDLRESFFELMHKTFGFHLKEWYENGFWGESYRPYSLADGNKIIANVSVNRMDITMNGEQKSFIQLGTVMTEEAYRGQGLGRYLMEAVLKDYKHKTDGIYLFANESVLKFYPKFGFMQSREYRYHKSLNPVKTQNSMHKVNMKSQEEKKHFLDTLIHPAVNNNIHMDNYCLYAFYLTGMMEEQIYYNEKEKAYAVAEIRDDCLMLHQIIASHVVDMDQMIDAFGPGLKEVFLGFVPLDTEGYSVDEYQEDDCTLFIMGEGLNDFKRQQLRFPMLSHA